ncbi:MAG: hypothetical protein AAGK22_21390 [Acidobacteriota bacterium]
MSRGAAQSLSRCGRLVLFALCALLSLASKCTEPERRQLQLCLAPEGGAVLLLEVAWEGPQGDEGSPLERRLAASRRSLEEQTSPWSMRFAAMEPALADGLRVSRLSGEMQRYERWMVIEDASRLDSFFSDTPVRVFSAVSEGGGELVLMPGPGDRATREERRRVERALNDFATALSRYFEAVGRLYAWLDKMPEAAGRRERAWQRLAGTANVSSLGERGDELVEAVRERQAAVLDVFDVSKEEAYSLQEASRRVFDPFPADLTVSVPGQVVEAVGLSSVGGAWRLERTGLWDAVVRLQGRWVSPDPLLEEVGSGSAGDRDEVASAPEAESLRYRPVVRSEVLEALWHELAPWEEYSLRWTAGPSQDHCEELLASLGLD